MSIDTLGVVRRLEAAGTPRDQAEALAEVLRDAESRSLAELATKADLALLEQRLEAKIEQLEQRMTIKLGGMMVVAVGAVAALVRLL